MDGRRIDMLRLKRRYYNTPRYWSRSKHVSTATVEVKGVRRGFKRLEKACLKLEQIEKHKLGWEGW
jgi:hypothetical protein